MATVVATAGLFQAGFAQAGILQYDPNSGKNSTVAPKTAEQPPLPAKTQNTAPQGGITLPPVQKPSRAERQSEPGVPYGLQLPMAGPLGIAQVFLKAEDVDAGMIKNIAKMQAYKGLKADLFIQHASPETFLKIYQTKGVEKELKNLELRVDMNGFNAMRQKATDYETILYIDPNNHRRRYNTKREFSKFLRHLKRIQREQKKQGRR